MFEHYRKLANKYKKLDLNKERNLIEMAQRGNKHAREKLLLHLTGFFLFRVQTTLYPYLWIEYGEDVLQDCMLFAMENIRRYRMRYINKKKEFQPLHMSTYFWKGITGIILNYVKDKREKRLSSLPDGMIKDYMN
jgi:hypothetical protein